MKDAKREYKLVVISDTHGNIEAVESLLPMINGSDYLIFLGDGFRDVEKLESEITAEIVRVKGNCDFGSDLPTETVLRVGNTDFLITHGNAYGVKSSLLSLVHRARELDCAYALYGHTHVAKVFDAGGVTCINPGSAARVHYPTYAVIKGDGEFFQTEIVDL